MLSVVIATDNSERPLVKSLASLVPGAMAGLITEVVIADAGSQDATLKVAEAAGCDVVTASASLGARLHQAAKRTRGAWLMFLRPGVVLETGWIDETTSFLQNAALESGRDYAALFRAGWSPYGKSRMRRALGMMMQALAGPSPWQGLIIRRAAYDALGGHRSNVTRPEEDLLLRLGRRRRFVLHARAFAPDR